MRSERGEPERTHYDANENEAEYRADTQAVEQWDDDPSGGEEDEGLLVEGGIERGDLHPKIASVSPADLPSSRSPLEIACGRVYQTGTGWRCDGGRRGGELIWTELTQEHVAVKSIGMDRRPYLHISRILAATLTRLFASGCEAR